MKFKIYCDGSCRNNGGKSPMGAWGYVLLDENNNILLQNCESVPMTTNQRMELEAGIRGCIAVEEYLKNNEITNAEIEIYTDSAYLYNCYSQKWYRTWLDNGWRTAKKEKVANQDLWSDLVKYFLNPNFIFIKTKGHADDKWNNYVDEMVQSASIALKEESKQW